MYTSNDLRIDVVFLESHLLSPSPILPLPTMEKVEEGERERDVCGRSEMCSGILGMPLIELPATRRELELKLG